MSLIKNFPHDGIVTINRVIIKEGHTLDELQERVALMCENVKTYHSETGFIGGMVVLNSGQISNEGSNVGKALDSNIDAIHGRLLDQTSTATANQHICRGNR